MCTDKGSASKLNQALVYEILKAQGCAFEATPLPALKTVVHPVEITGLYGNKDQIVRARFEHGDLTLEIREAQGGWRPEVSGLPVSYTHLGSMRRRRSPRMNMTRNLRR